ncbi:MAG: peptide ABC transporter substrate-binding protein [Candidatus Latescibacteria bacterium]|nr:peptide ABC transporter substrate-binding protein [Candidatus Latescibacterota bacterium]
MFHRSLITTSLLIILITTSAAGQERNALGRLLPSDAAPLDQQRMRLFEIDGTYMEWFKTIYKRSPATDLISEPLVRVNRDYEIIPAGAMSWEASPDGNAWYFHLRPNMQWTDGRPFTAEDYVYTFKRGADPANAYDFEWYYRTIKNWQNVVTRKMPLDSLGVRAVDDVTLEVRTEQPVPYLPYNLAQSWASPRQAVEKYGDEWSTKPEWSVSSGPFMLSEWYKNERIVLNINPDYRGAAPPYLEQVIFNVFSQAGLPQMLAAYESGEVDMIALAGQAALGRVRSDPVMRDELHTMVNFVTFYLTMDTYNPPFDNLKVRQAFSHAVDRQALLRSALKDIGVEAYSMLPPGFPGSDPSAFEEVQDFDPQRARELLAEAGYPDGQGFPTVDIWLRTLDSHSTRTPAEAIQAMLSDALNIKVGIRAIERKVFTDGLNNHEITLALVPYSQDYPDPSNLLGLWLSGGRHAWHDDDFERLVREGNEFMGPTADRFEIYQAAERRLVEDVGGIFIWHPVEHRLWKSYFSSPDLMPNRRGDEVWSGTALMTGYIKQKVARDLPGSLLDRLTSWLFGTTE